MLPFRLHVVAWLITLWPLATFAVAEQRLPNILWISCEDISPHLGCYGDPHAITPNLDQLAGEGVRYSHAFTTAGVCAPCRSGIITGMYQTTLGTHHMRCTATLPDQIRPFPMLLREAGYYCTNQSKQDYQFKTPSGTWDASSKNAHWRNRPNAQTPFFAVFNFTGCHESGIANKAKYEKVTEVLSDDQRQDPLTLDLPPYYPDTPVVREDWKRNYELITAMDHWAGELVQQLIDDGLYEQTIIMFWSDHGVGLPRAKRWLYDSGTHIPLIVRIPERFRVDDQGTPGTVSDRLVSSIDFGPTVLNLAGVDVPEIMQGRPFLGTDAAEPRDYVYGARDRMDERYDIIRMVRDKRFKYLRNYEPLKSYYQYINTAEKGATMQELRRGHEAGKLTEVADAYFAPSKPVEELYDCDADPHEINNLADDQAYADVLQRMRSAHRDWVRQTADLGLIPEPILAERVGEAGSEYAILHHSDQDTAAADLGRTAELASSGPSVLPELIQAAADHDNAIRYWAAVGIGNIGPAARSEASALMTSMLQDESSAVRTAAARALGRMGLPEAALPVLIDELTTGAQWERLHAAIVLDEMDQQAAPVAKQMAAGLQYQPGFNSDGKYRVRVINRALNELNGTDHVVD
ncbi:sulfatase-like hydrolase/transferase [Roseiconus nitratireducens]|uniref:Sulfatase-like hydrolase/transferase n=1 Tax=Roseiconus nitratireducens TaxID=2605748 RepID=A0A5M6D8H4_9BACT|nr:sulfatase-like hydrolase/transferase [Roseiconus nitratireducens]KAA5543844.1 sulfatase-like hydrolase/transferase [Roseiconus nitratireducens]